MVSFTGSLSLATEIVRQQASILIFGNGAGIRSNRIGRTLIAAARSEKEPLDPPSARHAGLAEHLRRVGFSTAEPGYDRKLLERLRDDVTACLDDPGQAVHAAAAKVPGVDIPSVRLRDAVKSVPGLRSLVNQEVAAVVSAYFGAHFRVVEIAAWRNHHIPDAGIDAYSNFWHFDRLNVAHLKYFVNLGDRVDRFGGAFRAHSVSKSRAIARAGFLNRAIVVGRARNLIETPDDMFSLEGDLGAAAFVNTTLCLHRAGVPRRDNPRTMVSFTFLPARAPLAQEWTLDRPKRRNEL
jgi:hypothetical protein